jgi:mannose-6-phosphate isomerase
VAALIELAMRCGYDDSNGRIADEIGEDGSIRAASSRCWPHAEALKALTGEALCGNLQHSQAILPILSRMANVHCRSELNGGWIDRVDAKDFRIGKTMPASAFYHIFFGIMAIRNFMVEASA